MAQNRLGSGAGGESTIAIIGGGIIGLSCALALADRGARVTLYEANKLGSGASAAAAGLLAPAFEAGIELAEAGKGEGEGRGVHEQLYELCLASARLWGDYAARLSQALGQSVSYCAGPSLALARDEAEAKRLEVLARFLAERGEVSALMTPTEVREHEPAITGPILCGLSLPGDGYVDTKRVLSALIAACEASGRVQLYQNTPAPDLKNLLGLYELVLYTNGWQWQVDPIFQSIHKWPKIEPVGGQILALSRVEGGPWQSLRSGGLYITPREDRIIVGATVEPGVVLEGTDRARIEALRAQAAELCGALAAADIIEAHFGMRPATLDKAPLLGAMSDRVYVATGHYRNGILLAPISGQMMADVILEGAETRFDGAFGPMRPGLLDS